MRQLGYAVAVFGLCLGSTTLGATTITVHCGQSRPCAGGYNPYNPASYNAPQYYGPNARQVPPASGGVAPSPSAHLVVRSGGTINVYKIAAIDPDCRSRGAASVRLITAPRGGQARIIRTHDYVAFNPVNPRSACNHRKIAATEILYHSYPGFVGVDTFQAEIIDPDGGARTRQMTVEVR